MAQDEGRVELRTDIAHPARIYDYLLGGKDNFPVDRAAASEIVRPWPSLPVSMRANRQFMRRATHFLAAEAGVDQFLDIGAGLPTEPNLHQVAQAEAPESVVVYSDNDPIVMQYAQALLRSTPQGRTAYVQADVRDPESILYDPELSDALDLGRPVALCVNALFHFVSDEQRPREVLATLLGALPAGSYLALTHITEDFVTEQPPPGADRTAVTRADSERVRATYASSNSPLISRSRAEVLRFFDGLELVEPGLVPPHLWHPEPATPRYAPDGIPFYAGVARKP